MCTLGALSGKYLFKTRDLWADSDRGEEIISGHGRYRYVGVRGHASPLERGLNSGINEKGVAVAITFADTVSLAQALSSKTPRGVLVEEILRSCGDMPSALHLAADFLTVPLVGGNIVVLTTQGGFVLEQLYPRFAFELISTPLTVRTNHFLNLTIDRPLLGNCRNSVERLERMSAILGTTEQPERLELDDIKAALADHEGACPVCSHGGELRTVSAVIYDLPGRSLHHAGGTPCCARWKQYAIGGGCA